MPPETRTYFMMGNRIIAREYGGADTGNGQAGRKGKLKFNVWWGDLFHMHAHTFTVRVWARVGYGEPEAPLITLQPCR